MAIYNETIIDSGTGLTNMIINIGVVVGNQYLIGNLLLLGFFVIYLVKVYNQDFLETVLVDGLLTTVLAFLLFAAEMVAWQTIIIPAIIFFIALIIYLFS